MAPTGLCRRQKLIQYDSICLKRDTAAIFNLVELEHKDVGIMPPLCWLTGAVLFIAMPVAAITNSAEWYFSLPVVSVLLLLVVLFLYSLQLRRNNASLHAKQDMMQHFMQRSDDLIAVMDKNLAPTYINPALAALAVSATSEHSLTHKLYLDKHNDQPLLQRLDLQGNWSGEAWLQTQINSDRVALSVTITALGPRPAERYLLIARDISAAKQLQHDTVQTNTRDADTGLLNLPLLSEYLQSFVNFTTNAHPKFALLLVKFNQLLNSESDKPQARLQDMMAEISEHLQQMTAKQYILARYNSDTFAVLIPPHLCNAQPDTELSRLGHKLLTLPEQLTATDRNTCLQTWVGCSIYPLDGANATKLLFSASNALQSASKQGNSAFLFANPKSQQRAPEYLALETELHKAVLQGEFDVYYQPRVSISSNRVTGFEALLRWHNPKHGVLLPQHFLSVADETGLIIQLDQLAFKKCCEQIQHWQHAGINRGRMSLNIANLSFCQADFVDTLQQQLVATGLNADQFELELNEDLLLRAEANTHHTLQRLTSLGFHLTLDNFGTGVSSLSVLRQYSLHSLKIAPDFIKDMEHNEQQRNITASLIRMATYLQLDVIASGIENEMQAYLLHVMGCDILQGYLFSKPLPATEIPALLAKENKLIRKEVS
jgi:EAL domain-containing protein (putative c-di-GMP-specific phosphodiesterase class I)/GGDEF domain-containing protein